MFRRTTLISLTALLCGLGSSAAQADMTCTKAPDCASLGYTQTEAECASKPSIKCPFDTSKYYCKKIVEVDGCTVGSYLYTDQSCSKTRDINKVMVGIVFDPVKKLAVYASDLNGYISLEKTYLVSGRLSKDNMQYCSAERALVDCGTDGKENSKKLKIYLEAGETGTAFKVESFGGIYTPSPNSKNLSFMPLLAPAHAVVGGTTWYGYGHWFIPSLKELQDIFHNIEEIVGLEGLGHLPAGALVSSTLNDEKNYFAFSLSDGVSTVETLSSTLAIINYGETSSLTHERIIYDLYYFYQQRQSSQFAYSDGYICLYGSSFNLGCTLGAFRYISQGGGSECPKYRGSDGRYHSYVRWCDKCNKQFYQCCNSAYQSGCEAVD